MGFYPTLVSEDLLNPVGPDEAHGNHRSCFGSHLQDAARLAQGLFKAVGLLKGAPDSSQQILAGEFLRELLFL